MKADWGLVLHVDKKPRSQYPPGKKSQSKNQKMEEPFTMVPTRFSRSHKLDAAEKIIFINIMGYNPSFPSYEKLMADCQLSRWKVANGIKRLKEMGLITVHKKGRSNLYVHHWNKLEEPVWSPDYTSTATVLEPVCPPYSNNINLNKTNKQSGVFENNVDENNLTPEQIKANMKRIKQLMKGIGDG